MFGMQISARKMVILIEGCSGFSQPLQENVGTLGHDSFLPQSFQILYLNSRRPVIWATNGVKETIHMYNYINKYIIYFYNFVWEVYNRFRRHRPVACLFQSCVVLSSIRSFNYSAYSSVGFSLFELFRYWAFIIENIGSPGYKLSDVIK
jgi:hypothetical protein